MKLQLQKYLQKVEADTNLLLGDKVEALLHYCTELFNMEIGILARIIGQEYTVIKVHSPDPEGIKPGDAFVLDMTYCTIVVSTQQTVGFSNIGITEWSNHPAYKKFGLKSYYGTPIMLKNSIYGTLNFSSSKVLSDSIDQEIVESIEILSKWIVNQLELNPEAPSLCSIVCDNEGSCLFPLKWCSKHDPVVHQLESAG